MMYTLWTNIGTLPTNRLHYYHTQPYLFNFKQRHILKYHTNINKLYLTILLVKSEGKLITL